jgi:hypothetical protein
MAQLEYYKSNNNKYLAKIDLSKVQSSISEQESIFICLLDKSSSMEDNVYIYVKEIFPLVLEKLKCDKKQNILITYDDFAQKYSGTADYYRNQNLRSGGGNQLYVGLCEVEKIFDEYIKSNTNLSIRLLTISDGDIGNESNLYKKIEELIKKIQNKIIVNSHAVRYFTSDSPPDTKGLSSMLKLNNITIGKLIDIKLDEREYDERDESDECRERDMKDDDEKISTRNPILETKISELDYEQISTKIAELFLDDGLDELYKVTSESKNLYDFPWSEPSSQLLLKKGNNFIWFENLNKIQIKNSSNTKIETTNSSKGEINSRNYTEILKEKFFEIKKKATIFKIMNSNESNNELKSLITNLEKYEKDISGNSNKKNYYFSDQIKKINSINFQNQSSDELAYSLQMIDEEIKQNINQKLKKDISLNELFLCPQCLKKIPLFISFTINENNDIYVNYLCLCKNKFEAIKLDDLLKVWNNNKNISSKCNSHSAEGKYCLKCNKWLCPDCIIVHEDIKSSHKDLITKNELILNNKCDEHKKNKIGFCCSCYKEICSTCAGFFNDGHVKYTHQDKWKDIYDNLDFHSIDQFEGIVNKMNKKILEYKNNQLKKLDNIIDEINNLKEKIENKYNLILKNNENLTKYYENLLKTFLVYEDIPSYIINENTSKFQFNKNFFIVENESNKTFSEIARATFETLETCNLYQLMYYPEIKKSQPLYELNTNDGDISSLIQLADGTIVTGHYNKKKVSFYTYNFKKLTENSISTPGYVTCLCEINDNILAIGIYNPYNILLYDLSEKENGTFKLIKTLEGHSGKINSIIDINDNYLASGGAGSYEIFIWDKKNNYNLKKYQPIQVILIV